MDQNVVELIDDHQHFSIMEKDTILNDYKLKNIKNWKVNITQLDICNAMRSYYNLSYKPWVADSFFNLISTSKTNKFGLNNSHELDETGDQFIHENDFELNDIRIEEKEKKISSLINQQDDSSFIKMKELKKITTKGRIGWAMWKNIMWPCKIKRIQKDSTGHIKAYVTYYESMNGHSKVFRVDPAKVEFFYRPVELNETKHFRFKNEAIKVYENTREFLKCYNDALADFIIEICLNSECDE